MLFTGDNQISARLRAWRANTAKTSGVELFKILNNATIDLIALIAPQTLEELADVKGIGPAKLKKYGPAILAAVAGEVDELGLNSTSVHPDYSQENKDPDAYTVSQFLDRINALLSDERGKVQGEISGLQLHPSGVYFSLKDKEADSVMSCYLSNWKYRELGVTLVEGMEIIVGGQANVHKPKGRLSFVVSSIELIGAGALQKAYEELKKQLEQEGLFGRQRPLPDFIERIGIITSVTGAVINDFRKNLDQHGFKVKIFDTRVEGAQAVRGVLSGIKYFNECAAPPEILIVMRGGGSLEDLQAFNNEKVARALFASRVPTLSAIGHDRDVPISNLVADMAVSTPTAAAQLINDTWGSLVMALPVLQERLMSEMRAQLIATKNKIPQAVAAISAYVEGIRRDFDRARETILGSMTQAIQLVGQAVKSGATAITAYSPERNLSLGYSIVFNKAGKVVRRVADVVAGDKLTTRVSDGTIESEIKR